MEACTGAWLLQRRGPQPFGFNELGDVVAFLGLAALAPIGAATVIATTDALIGKHEFASAWGLVWLGDATGLLISGPLALSVMGAWRVRKLSPLPRQGEAVLTAIVLVGVTALAFAGVDPGSARIQGQALFLETRGSGGPAAGNPAGLRWGVRPGGRSRLRREAPGPGPVRPPPPP
ncbi:MAG: MASE1 domain-containing protein [Caulobacteraceae bacterium]|nr:MASE1 domain-containing protein [Caulobacteraceae bacterium]